MPRKSPAPLQAGLLLRSGLRTVETFAPALTAQWAESLFLKPPRHLPREDERMALGTGHRFTFRWNGRDLAAWSWGDGPTIFFLHGWGGRGGQFHRFIRPLVEAGFSVVLFDAPAHGETGGRQSSLVEFADTLTAFLQSMGPAHGFVGHSMGAAAATLALYRGARIPRVVFLACPAEPKPYSRRWAEALGLSEETRVLMERRLEDRLQVPFADLSVVKAAPLMKAQLLLIHDRDDQEVPLSTAQSIASAWPAAELHRTESLGHFRLLKDPHVIARTVAFLREGVHR